MNEIESFLDTVVNLLNKINGLPSIAVVFLSCIVVGYVLRFVKRFPNDGIPIAVILWGAAFNPLLADLNSDMGWRVWFIKNFLFGLLWGYLAWLVHNKVLSKIEGSIPVIGDKLAGDKPTPIPPP